MMRWYFPFLLLNLATIPVARYAMGEFLRAATMRKNFKKVSWFMLQPFLIVALGPVALSALAIDEGDLLSKYLPSAVTIVSLYALKPFLLYRRALWSLIIACLLCWAAGVALIWQADLLRTLAQL